MSIRSKLILGFSLLLAFILFEGAASYYYGGRTQALVDGAINRNFAVTLEISDMVAMAHQLRREEKDYLIYAGDVDGRNAVLKSWSATLARLDARLHAMGDNLDGHYSSADVIEFRRWEQALGEYRDRFMHITEGFSYDVSMLDQGDESDSSAAYLKAVRANREMAAAVERLDAELIAGATRIARARAAESAAAQQRIRQNFQVVERVSAGLAVCGLLLAGVLLLTVPGSIARPLQALVEAADKMSLGDLGKKFEAGGVREFEALAASLERMRVTMEAMILRLKARSR